MSTRAQTPLSPAASLPWTNSLALFLLRVVVGGVLLAHGAQKIFEYTPAGTAASFEKMGVPAAAFVGPAVGWLELIGGALIVVGLLTRVVAALLAVDMLGALFLVHLKAGLFVAQGGFEFVAVLAAVLLALVLAGPGKLALDAAVMPRMRRSRAAQA